MSNNPLCPDLLAAMRERLHERDAFYSGLLSVLQPRRPTPPKRWPSVHEVQAKQSSHRKRLRRARIKRRGWS